MLIEQVQEGDELTSTTGGLIYTVLSVARLSTGQISITVRWSTGEAQERVFYRGAHTDITRPAKAVQ